MDKLPTIRASHFLLFAFLFFTFFAVAQNGPIDPPKLVVGIVVDQMRYDFLLKYWDKFGDGGFRRLMRGGLNCDNTHYNYSPTYTGPGHASIYTGTTPAVHGIVGNDFFSEAENRVVNCVNDDAKNAVGGVEATGHVSPKRMLSTTISDELRLFSNKKSKVIGISLKDRGAVLPAGHCPNGAYWFDTKTVGWMTSDWFASELPGWVKAFNQREWPAEYAQNPWIPLPETLLEPRSIADNNRYEDTLKHELAPVFPHNLPMLAERNGLGLTVMNSPFGNSLTVEFAKTALENEHLGEDEWPDLLAVSFSSPDLIGHTFGPTSVEIEDTYLRLDRDLADFMDFLDKKVGSGSWLMFLTADHGVAYNSNYLNDNHIPAGFWNADTLRNLLNRQLARQFSSNGLVRSAKNGQVHFDHEKIAADSLDFEKIQAASMALLEKQPGVFQVFTRQNLLENEYRQPPASLVQRGYHRILGGDLVVIFGPGWLEFGEKGTSHGSVWSYDTRVPCLFYGWKVRKGTFSGRVNITDIAPTISLILNIPFPSGCTGEPILRVLD